MTYHLDIDDDTDCEGRLDLVRVSATAAVVRCVLCGEEMAYVRN